MDKNESGAVKNPSPISSKPMESKKVEKAKEKMFVSGKIQIPVEFNFDRKTFNATFQGGNHGENLPDVWEKYQKWLKVNK